MITIQTLIGLILLALFIIPKLLAFPAFPGPLAHPPPPDGPQLPPFDDHQNAKGMMNQQNLMASHGNLDTAPEHYVMFEQVGQMASSITYLHVAIPLNLTTFEQQARMIATVLNEFCDKVHGENAMFADKPSVQVNIITIAHHLKERLERALENIFKIDSILPSQTPNRSKRFLFTPGLWALNAHNEKMQKAREEELAKMKALEEELNVTKIELFNTTEQLLNVTRQLEELRALAQDPQIAHLFSLIPARTPLIDQLYIKGEEATTFNPISYLSNAKLKAKQMLATDFKNNQNDSMVFRKIRSEAEWKFPEASIYKQEKLETTENTFDQLSVIEQEVLLSRENGWPL